MAQWTSMIRSSAAAVLLAVVAGCSTPIGVNRVGMDRAYAQITANALTGAQLSDDTRLVLGRYGLDQLFRQSPDLALIRLHETACRETRRDVLFALAEASYAAAQGYEDVTWIKIHQDGNEITLPGVRAARAYYFAAALYSYLYLFSEGLDAPPDPFDRRYRLACDFYNRGLAKALKALASDRVELTPRTLRLPMGSVQIEINRAGFPWTEAQFHEFVAADEYVVRGIDYRNREPGLGVPLIGIPDRGAFGAQWPRYYPASLKVPATALLRPHGTVRDMSGHGLKATLELYSAYTQPEIKVAGQSVPLETDMTATLAYNLEGSVQWKARTAQLLSGKELIPTGIYLIQPYEPGKIPVVLVHGTAGSPSDWAGCFNGLQADATLRSRFQFWYFIYNTGNPIAYSGALLREEINKIVQTIDPNGHDPSLRKMVIAGHSQGGLVTKLTAVRSGDKFTRLLTDRPIDELSLPEADRQLLRRVLNVEPSPYVRRVIFVSTPHRGSILVNTLIQRLGQRLISTPQQLTRLGAQLATLNLGRQQSVAMKKLGGKIPTSVANMNPENPWLNVLHDLPLADGIKAHSIIAVKPGLDVQTGNDGIVAYTSAHLDGVESEFIVRYEHTCQNQPPAIEEIRRILLQHLRELHPE